MATKDRGPTLTDRVGMGGAISQEGFDYQVWQGLVRLPAWLRNPAFEALIFEGLEDFEARFFAPHAPEQRLLERFQAKSGSLAAQDVKKVFNDFHAFEETYPHITRVHTIITQQLPASLKWIARDAARVRRARPFYAPFAPVREASDTKFIEDMVKELGEPLGRFVAEGVEAVEDPMPSRAFALNAFGVALEAAFPTLELQPRRVEAAFDALVALAGRLRGAAISRTELAITIESAASATLLSLRSFPIHIRSDRNESKEGALEVDACAFSGGGAPFPDTSRWTSELTAPLEATARWLRQHSVSRISISGSYRLTTAFLVGRSFRSAHGFEVEIPTREGSWVTDDRPGSERHAPWRIAQPQALHEGRLVVSVGVLRHPLDELVAAGVAPTAILDCFLEGPIASGKAAQAGVARVKDAVAAVASRMHPSAIDLYVAGPAAFAVALGHRWNALPPTHLHEFASLKRVYVETAICS